MLIEHERWESGRHGERPGEILIQEVPVVVTVTPIAPGVVEVPVPMPYPVFVPFEVPGPVTRCWSGTVIASIGESEIRSRAGYGVCP